MIASTIKGSTTYGIAKEESQIKPKEVTKYSGSVGVGGQMIVGFEAKLKVEASFLHKKDKLK